MQKKILAFGFLFCLFTTVPTVAQDWQQYRTNAQQAFQNNQYTQALAFYRLAKQSGSGSLNNPKEYLNLLHEYLLLANEFQQFPLADTLIQEILRLPNQDEPYQLQLKIQTLITHLGLDRLEAAEPLLAKLQKEPSLRLRPSFVLAMAKYWIKKEKLQKAQGLLTKLVQQNLSTLEKATIHILQSEIQYRQGHFQSALQSANLAFNLLQQSHRGSHPISALALDYRALQAFLLGKPDEPIADYLAAQSIWDSLGMTQHPAYARVLEGLFLVNFAKGDDPQLALENIEKALKINLQYKPGSMAVVDNLVNLAQWKNQYEDFNAARALTKRAVEIASKNGQKFEYAQTLNALGALYIQNAYLQNMKPGWELTNLIHIYEDSARLCFQQAQQIYRQLPHSNYWLKANILSNWASSDTSHIPLKAVRLYKKALHTYARFAGKDNAAYLAIWYNLAVAYDLSNQKLGVTKKNYLEVLNGAKKVLGANNPEYVFYLFRIAPFFVEANNLALAYQLFTEVKEKQLFLIDNYYRAFQDAGRLYHAARIQAELSYYCSFLEQHQTQIPQSLFDLQSMVITLKSLSVDYSLVNLLKRTAQLDSNIIHQLDLFENVQDSISIMLESVQEQTEEINNLIKYRDQLERLIKANVANPFPIKHFYRDSLLAQLTQNEVVIDFFRIYNYDVSRAEVYDTTYYAMIDRPSWSSPKLIKLCTEENLLAYLSLDEQNIPKLLSFPQQRFRLYNLLWKPLEPYLQEEDTIHYALDGLLHGLNFYTLVTNSQGDSALFQKYHLSLHTDFRNFNKQSKTVEFKLLNVFANAEASFPEMPLLEAVAHELDTLSKMAKERGIDTQLFVGKTATPRNLFSLEQCQQPYAVHIACHSFALDNTEKEELPTAFSYLITNYNPLYRSGLLLQAADTIGLDSTKGVVLAHELARMDLSNCQFMALSSCESGLGWIENLEGVIGFQYALKTAGVKSLLLSLWKVKDEPTSVFMGHFYRHYLAERSASKALQKTIEDLSKIYGPDVWGAFVLVD